MKLNTYEFRVCFGEGRYAKGTYSVRECTEEAANVYNAFARELFGEYMYKNN